MVSKERFPHDPHVRLQLFALILKKERRLVMALVVSIAIFGLVWSQVLSPTRGAWSANEISNMDGLPLNPRGTQVQVDTAGGPEQEAFLQMQKELSNQPQPDLLDGKSAKGGG